MSMHNLVALNAAPVQTRDIELPTGILSIRVDSSELPLEELCGFAARRNPKRGFLFVSKVLGKHIPVSPSRIRDIHTRLARQIGDVPGPVVVVGMAETAIALGHGVFDEFVRLSGRHDVVFLHSTRYRLNREVAVEFLEEHSHAADHIIYRPQDARSRALFEAARTLVLVDDEASTGKTFVNLVKAMSAVLPRLEKVVTAVITDWRGPARTAETLAAMPYPASTLAVLKGEYSFSAAPNLVAVNMPKVVGDGSLKDGLITSNFGRLGLTPERRLNGSFAGSFGSTSSFRSAFVERRHPRILVLGTGEFAYPPFLLAEDLERSGIDVRYQSTTRSPIMEGLAIGTSLTFGDNYGDGIPNFLYNARREDYDHVVVCHETPAHTVDPSLLASLRAEPLEFRL